MLQEPLAEIGHTPSADVLRSDLAALQEVGLIEINEEKSGALFAGAAIVSWTITQDGVDVAAGRKHEPGIRQPKPYERQ